MARTQTNTQDNTKHVENQDATDIQKKTIFQIHFNVILRYKLSSLIFQPSSSLSLQSTWMMQKFIQ